MLDDKIKETKSLILIDYTGGAYSSFATSPFGAASQLASAVRQLSGVSKPTNLLYNFLSIMFFNSY